MDAPDEASMEAPDAFGLRVAGLGFFAREGSQRRQEIGQSRTLQRGKRQWPRHLHGGNADAGGHHAVDHAFAELGRQPRGEPLADGDTMNVTISVRVDDDMVPVIGMSLKRVDDTAVGAIARQ